METIVIVVMLIVSVEVIEEIIEMSGELCLLKRKV